ncbi:MAG TPA: hypothetical protein ENI63_02150 [Candidatus Kaiserbacteria bacterium]|nr:hypothetical protein [Candidatus Kaiserbacteria bacterium]
MEPLSRKTRIFYLTILIIIFVILVPITLLYSSGYRLGDGFKLVKTGGIYVGLNESNAELFLDGKLVKKVGILKDGFFVQDLTPRVYYVVVKKDGYRKWEKILEVLPKRVSETSAFILPNNIPYTEIIPSSTAYTEALKLFSTSTETQLIKSEYPEILATSTNIGKKIEDVKRKGNIVLWREGNSIYARWVNDNGNAPSYFCRENGVCDKEILINKKPVQFFDFHPKSNELLLFVINDVVVMTEIDPRIPRNIQTLFEAKGVKIRTQGDYIFIKEPTKAGIKIFKYKL